MAFLFIKYKGCLRSIETFLNNLNNKFTSKYLACLNLHLLVLQVL